METLKELLDGVVDYRVDNNADWLLRLKDMTVGYYKDQDIFKIYPDKLNGQVHCLSAGEAFEDIKRLLTLK